MFLVRKKYRSKKISNSTTAIYHSIGISFRPCLTNYRSQSFVRKGDTCSGIIRQISNGRRCFHHKQSHILKITWARYILLNLRSTTWQKATLLFLTYIYSCRSVRVDQLHTSIYDKRDDINGLTPHWATSPGTKVRTIIILVPTEQGRQRVKLRHLNFDPYSSRSHTGPWATLVAIHATMRMY